MSKRRARKRPFLPWADRLEARLVPSGLPTATWIGQDGHDDSGGATAGAGNGIQDIHIALANLPAGDPISSILMQGYGWGAWAYQAGQYSVYGGVMYQSGGATTADWYVDPYQNETGRPFTLTITYADGASNTITMQGGTANRSLYMPADHVAAQWIGQDGHDYTGQSVDVGPDGLQDVHIALTHLYGPTAILAATITDPLGDAWGAGTNPSAWYRAEFLRNAGDPTQADLDFGPNRNLNGQVMTVTIDYADGTVDKSTVVAGSTNPSLAMPAQAPVSLNWQGLGARWLGQDGLNLIGVGDVHLAMSGIPAGRSVASATLSDQVGDDWSYSSTGSPYADPSAWPLGFRAGSAAGQADLTFQPLVDESGATLTLTVTLDNGAILAARVAGGACDPGLREPDVSPTTIVAHPGDDLQTLANRYGTVRLAAGLYLLTSPLVLHNPVTIAADPGVTLLFSQSADAPTWDTAIKVRASHTTLDGFAVRFAGPVRWAANVSYSAAIVGWSDNFDPWSPDPGLDLTFRNLDIQSPPAATSWEQEPSAFRLVGAESGQVVANRIKGGLTELAGGPWQVVNNDYLGTMPNTFTYGAFATHYTRDVTVAGNLVEPTGPSGKTWRFLVMTNQGFHDLIANNTIVGVGPMDADTVPNPNASELILSESYRLHYEGMVGSVSPDGTVVQVAAPQAGQARTGDVVAILSGPQAGQYRTIAQVINPTTYVLDSPIVPGSFAVSIETGFVGETFRGNYEDARGSSTAADLVLAGNQFGLSVVDNQFLGGGMAFKVTAAPTELPMMWGWSHAPLLGATISGNSFTDTVGGGLLDVEHGQYIANDAGRVYFSGTFSSNLGIWTPTFLAAQAARGTLVMPVLATVGDPLAADPGDLVLNASGNQVQGASGATFRVNAAVLNGQATRNAALTLPTPGGVIAAAVVKVPQAQTQAIVPAPVPASATVASPPRPAPVPPAPVRIPAPAQRLAAPARPLKVSAVSAWAALFRREVRLVPAPRRPAHPSKVASGRGWPRRFLSVR